MKTIHDIPERYQSFPQGYVNDINGWGFSEKTIKENKGRLLTLDIDFGEVCSLNCPNCFRKNNSIDGDHQRILGFDHLVALIKEAKTLGLRSVKFLGAGEPFENHRFLEFLYFLKDEGIIPLIFTKGFVISNDDLVRRYFGYLGITTSKALVDALYECNASIMLGFNSFDPAVQARYVGAGLDYVDARDRALLMLDGRGFAEDHPTRLALSVNPITTQNIDEAFDIYQWGRLRNYYVIVTPTMISGRARKNWQMITPSEEALIKLYTDIYQFNIQRGLQTLEQIQHEGISAYAGGHPCNQVSAGLYITLSGKVVSCPGSETAIEGDIWETSLSEIWKGSENYKRRGTFNCHCVAKDGKSIPNGIYDAVI
uniref:Radical SAM superfamily enzyme, MoaA/NifB/PqqE/SkfB family n=1 Tax=Candidatus Kentrum sp. MB TaxID=2138164 RepID=A0A450XRG7_9GAMM|nr:MAG: Radical SAM superfamily enzyme, MoaA/NifB/PqqE/SkfB family [Candidatus Kentron sp. MB]VFK34831.1 MAG: Radical SAM superfamily enzyme, MoaA/NifB/PqqE/SkfB family [Candidatus Kentron sp. MB]VFK76971.1 MAG: Radical SAM superfamily enzyme, MoaA/NifB/PqqE/SkfB family [Candidatus Kentron sp. MB]